eukprot:m.79890 g.79890  ORF g.79890 m.79890 type:complete len:75 (-) comp11994_c1_seq1:46-270(-)
MKLSSLTSVTSVALPIASHMGENNERAVVKVKEELQNDFVPVEDKESSIRKKRAACMSVYCMCGVFERDGLLTC